MRNVLSIGQLRNVCRILVGRQEGDRPLGRLRHRQNDTVAVDHKEIATG